MNIQGMGNHHRGHGGGIEGFINHLQNDTSDEATSVKTAYQKLQDDIKAGASQDDLSADRASLTDAMKAYREKNPPPPRPEGGQGGQNFLQKLADKLQGDTSAEGTQLAAALKKLQDDSAGLDADKQSFMDALKAYFDKQRTQASGDDAGQVIDCQV